MSLRHSWKGFLKLSLVTVPVKAYPVSVSGAEIHLNQLHGCCKSRIKYKKTCPLHGDVVAADIVSGYEFATDQYVVVDPDELEQLRTESDKAIQIDAFIRMGTLDAIYAAGKSHYLVADGPVAHKGYAVLYRGMVDEKSQAIAQVVMNGKEQLVWLRPLDGLIVMTQLSYDNQITRPAALADDVCQTEVVAEELQLLRTLMTTRTPEKFDLAHYQDRYTQKLTQLIEAKVAGKEIIAAPTATPMQVINLVEALRQSVAATQKAAPKKEKLDSGSAKKKSSPAKSKPARGRKNALATAAME
jgi:DNA end-binding protein Ku